MDVNAIKVRLEALSVAMSDKGLIKPDPEFCVGTGSKFSCWAKYYESAASIYADGIKCFRAETAEDAIRHAEQWVSGLPSIQEARMAQFMRSLADTIDIGKANGIDTEFLNPLTEQMKRLSENALTFHPAE